MTRVARTTAAQAERYAEFCRRREEGEPISNVHLDMGISHVTAMRYERSRTGVRGEPNASPSRSWVMPGGF